jgi:diaminopropionate ammonia-lyase
MKINYIKNGQCNTKAYKPFLVTEAISQEVGRYHESFSQYHQTALVSLEALAKEIGVGKLYVKDESTRFGLNAFKVLGAAYAIGKALAKELKTDIQELPFEVLRERVKEELGGIKLAATTDGNHGRGVAWMGKELGLETIIYMPKGTTPNRLKHITDLGAKGSITQMNYDDTVRWVANEAKKEGWLVIQDTAWEGYEDVPVWIMQGYSTIAKEVIEALGEEVPTHIFLQAGVGAFAGVMAEVFYDYYKEACPQIVLVEAEVAACFYASAKKGEEVTCIGELNTIMAGLACGEANPIGYKVLTKLVDTFISAPDWTSANGMRIMANPLAKDSKIISGESGAVSVGVIESILTRPEYEQMKRDLGLDEKSIVLAFSTEGDTDQTVYRDIVWYGKYAAQS